MQFKCNWKTIGKHLEFDLKAIGNNKNAIGKQVEINWKQLERMQLEEIVMQLESGLQAIGKAISMELKINWNEIE